MEKIILLVYLSQHSAMGGLMVETFNKDNGKSVTTHYIPLTGETALKSLVTQYGEKDVEMIILGDIRGHEWNRRAFEERMDLVTFIAKENNLVNDPRFTALIAYNNMNNSPYLAEIRNTLFAKTKAEDAAPLNEKRKVESVISSLREANVRGVKVKTFIEKQLVPKNYTAKEIKVDTNFLKSKVTLGILQIGSVERSGISMKEILPYVTATDKKPVDLFLVKTGKSVELQYQHWAQSFVEVIKEQFKNSGFTVQGSTGTEEQSGVMFTGKDIQPEELYNLVGKAVKSAEQIILSEPVS